MHIKNKLFILIIVLSLFSFSFVYADLTDDLVSYYKFDSDINDSVGSADGTNIGTTFTTGKINQGVNFDGITDSITINSLPDITSTSDKTFAFWVKPNQTSDGYFFDCNNRFIISPYQNDVKSYAHYDGSSWKTFGSSSDVENDVWQFIVFVWSSSGSLLSVYKDGSQLGSTTSVTPKAVSGVIKRIGDQYGGGGSAPYNGDFDEFGIWDRALSSTEITELYNSGDGLQYPFNPETLSITNSTFNMTSEGGSGCTNWATDQSVECNTTDYRLKYVEFDTNLDANCSMKTSSHNYDSSYICSTTGGTSHSCALATTDLLDYGTDYVYIGCYDGTTYYNSTSLKVNQIAGGGTGLISCIRYVDSQCSVEITSGCASFIPLS